MRTSRHQQAGNRAAEAVGAQRAHGSGECGGHDWDTLSGGRSVYWACAPPCAARFLAVNYSGLDPCLDAQASGLLALAHLGFVVIGGTDSTRLDPRLDPQSSAVIVVVVAQLRVGRGPILHPLPFAINQV